MGKVIVIRHSDEEPSTKYMANLKKNEDGSYTASVDVVKGDDYKDYIKKNGPHFTEALAEYASKLMVNSNGLEHTWTAGLVKNICDVLNLQIPASSTLYDVTYTANMAYADFFPELLTEHQCIKYAIAVAADPDGYEGIQLCRWIADIMSKKESVDWSEFE